MRRWCEKAEAAIPAVRSAVYSIHRIPPATFRELTTCFPRLKQEASSSQDAGLFAVVTFQRSSEETYIYDEATKDFKDLCRESFLDVYQQVGTALKAVDGGVWMDAADPATGMPLSGDWGPSAFSEVDFIEAVLSFPIMCVGAGPQSSGCRMIDHPRFGLATYPATFFVKTSLNALLQAMDSVVIEK